MFARGISSLPAVTFSARQRTWPTCTRYVQRDSCENVIYGLITSRIALLLSHRARVDALLSRGFVGRRENTNNEVQSRKSLLEFDTVVDRTRRVRKYKQNGRVIFT